MHIPALSTKLWYFIFQGRFGQFEYSAVNKDWGVPGVRNSI